MLQFLLVFLQHIVLCAAPLHISLPPNGLIQTVPIAAQARSPGLLYEPALSSSSSDFLGFIRRASDAYCFFLGQAILLTQLPL